MKLYHNDHNGTFTDVTPQAGLAVSHFGLGVAVGDYDNDGFDDIFVSALGQSHLFHNNRNGTFTDVTKSAGMWAQMSFGPALHGSTTIATASSILWSPTMCSGVRRGDIYCTLDGVHKSYCTPESYKGGSLRLWHNLGNGKFEDATPKAGLLIPLRSPRLAVLDVNGDGWPDIADRERYPAQHALHQYRKVRLKNGGFGGHWFQ